ncbi:MAG: polysaccharide export protein, partial [Muribaculaceae bacterium]|nr:polysaccharide export protein [Muribaculaceae bacterium]
VRAPNGRLNLLEAISQAGDLTIFGKRDNIMIVRTNADGGRQVLRANINDPNIIVKPEYNLQQNDIIFVEPNATKTRSSWNMPPAATVALTSLGTIMSITTFIITLTK